MVSQNIFLSFWSMCLIFRPFKNTKIWTKIFVSLKRKLKYHIFADKKQFVIIVHVTGDVTPCVNFGKVDAAPRTKQSHTIGDSFLKESLFSNQNSDLFASAFENHFPTLEPWGETCIWIEYIPV